MSTLLVTLPSKIAESQLLPCEAITMISHPLSFGSIYARDPSERRPRRRRDLLFCCCIDEAHWCAGVCAVLAENTM